MNLESELKQALRRTAPPAGFAARVVGALSEQPSRRTPHRPAKWRSVAAALTLTVLAGAWAAHSAAERREGERARDEVLLAMHIAGSKVRTAQQHVRNLATN